MLTASVATGASAAVVASDDGAGGASRGRATRCGDALWLRHRVAGARRALDFEDAFHADLPMPGDRAVVSELARTIDLEVQGHHATVCAEVTRTGTEIGKDDVVLGAFAAANVDLDRVADLRAQRGVCRALLVEVHHLPVRHAGGQGELANGVLRGRSRGGMRRRGQRSCECAPDGECNCHWYRGEYAGEHLSASIRVAGQPPAGPIGLVNRRNQFRCNSYASLVFPTRTLARGQEALTQCVRRADHPPARASEKPTPGVPPRRHMAAATAAQ